MWYLCCIAWRHNLTNLSCNGFCHQGAHTGIKRFQFTCFQAVLQKPGTWRNQICNALISLVPMIWHSESLLSPAVWGVSLPASAHVTVWLVGLVGCVVAVGFLHISCTFLASLHYNLTSFYTTIDLNAKLWLRYCPLIDLWVKYFIYWILIIKSKSPLWLRVFKWYKVASFI